jgi:hypothetical protein
LLLCREISEPKKAIFLAYFGTGKAVDFPFTQLSRKNACSASGNLGRIWGNPCVKNLLGERLNLKPPRKPQQIQLLFTSSSSSSWPNGQTDKKHEKKHESWGIIDK